MIERRRFGYYLRAIKASERAARSLGVPVGRPKSKRWRCRPPSPRSPVRYTSVKTGFIDPESGFGILVSVQMVIVAALGGAGTLFRAAGRRANSDSAADRGQYLVRR